MRTKRAGTFSHYRWESNVMAGESSPHGCFLNKPEFSPNELKDGALSFNCED